jgi:hypothetical protein
MMKMFKKLAIASTLTAALFTVQVQAADAETTSYQVKRGELATIMEFQRLLFKGLIIDIIFLYMLVKELRFHTFQQAMKETYSLD